MLNKTSSFFFGPQRWCFFRALVIIIAVLLTPSYLFSLPWSLKHQVWEFLWKSSPLLSRNMCLVDIPVHLIMFGFFFPRRSQPDSHSTWNSVYLWRARMLSVNVTLIHSYISIHFLKRTLLCSITGHFQTSEELTQNIGCIYSLRLWS